MHPPDRFATSISSSPTSRPCETACSRMESTSATSDTRRPPMRGTGVSHPGLIRREKTTPASLTFPTRTAIAGCCRNGVIDASISEECRVGKATASAAAQRAKAEACPPFQVKYQRWARRVRAFAHPTILALAGRPDVQHVAVLGAHVLDP